MRGWPVEPSPEATPPAWEALPQGPAPSARYVLPEAPLSTRQAEIPGLGPPRSSGGGHLLSLLLRARGRGLWALTLLSCWVP